MPGGESWDTAQRAQRIEDSKERQRLFMEQLQRKVQHRKESADVNSKPCLAALLASAAKKVRVSLHPACFPCPVCQTPVCASISPFFLYSMQAGHQY